jgi:hypothetical protein
MGFLQGRVGSVKATAMWNIYELKGDKIAVATLVGQRADLQTARFTQMAGTAAG